MYKDRLHDLFLLMLRQTDNMAESAGEFIRRVAFAYTLELGQQADIPGQFLDDVLADLEAEILEMYRKTTYGFFSLQEYRQTKIQTR